MSLRLVLGSKEEGGGAGRRAWKLQKFVPHVSQVSIRVGGWLRERRGLGNFRSLYLMSLRFVLGSEDAKGREAWKLQELVAHVS